MVKDITGNPAFDASLQIEKGISIVHASGEIDVASAPMFATRLKEATDEAMSGLRVVVADLSDVSFLDSTGLGVLIDHQDYLVALGGDSPALRLVVTRPQVLKVFEITGLDQVFSISKTLEEATAESI